MQGAANAGDTTFVELTTNNFFGVFVCCKLLGNSLAFVRMVASCKMNIDSELSYHNDTRFLTQRGKSVLNGIYRPDLARCNRGRQLAGIC